MPKFHPTKKIHKTREVMIAFPGVKMCPAALIFNEPVVRYVKLSNITEKIIFPRYQKKCPNSITF